LTDGLLDSAAIRNNLFAMQRVGHRATAKMLAGVEIAIAPIFIGWQ
jgi:hypothetical protein